ncbi:hypothetical protein B0H17DRAFT_1134438 [Mycena rosella]|uniref:Uncharacterized protein n=1 Tax=Mycena rosella TaxID=1033263 RepID=A0AAD7DIK3_MYCRO|nr:hypothetical protein B0H17DRAFT_1134438 [Mycena rosella]
MSDHKSTPASGYYHEHACQQDGWTVLVSPPLQLLPLPFLPLLPLPLQVELVQVGFIILLYLSGTALAFNIPMNTNFIGATHVMRIKKYIYGASFDTAFVEICGIMGLNPSTAQIRYNWDNETKSNHPKETAFVAKSNKKRKEPVPSVERMSFEFTKYQKLKSHLSCAMYKGQLCHAKEISVGYATKLQPPENIVFQECFLPASKRARTNKSKNKSENNLCVPTIHVTINTRTSSAASPPAQSPLAPIMTATANAANVEHPSVISWSGILHTNSGSDNIIFPPMTDILQSMNDSGIFVDLVVLLSPATLWNHSR